VIEAGRHVVETAEDMHALGVELGSRLAAGDLVVLTGPLGAGKTTLTRGIGEGLGVRGPVQSPTFVIARTHPSLVGGAPLVHVDAYRLGDPREFDDLDLDLDRSVVVVEWGRDVVATVADEWIDIEIARPTGGADHRDRGAGSLDGRDEIDDSDVDEPRVVVVTAGRAGPRG
jgi:tRNA threonylcarbamoyl adenosine modification protein YjeE